MNIDNLPLLPDPTNDGGRVTLNTDPTSVQYLSRTDYANQGSMKLRSRNRRLKQGRAPDSQ